MKVSRKGSMQLSIEAIIVLVIAMVLLGLGIGFIQDFFAKGSSTLVKAFDPLEFGCNPTAQRPLMISPAEPDVRSGDTLPLKVCVYATVPSSNAIVGITGCKSTAAGVAGTPQLLAAPQPIKRTEIGGFDTILTAKNATGDGLDVGEYICTFMAVAEADAQGDFPFVVLDPATGVLVPDPTKPVIGTQQVTIKVT